MKPITRRTLLGALGATTLVPLYRVSAEERAVATASDDVLDLRLIETSDLHMFALDWDYYRAAQDQSVGFASTASLIRAARNEATNCLLFDNGDFLQGNPLADYIATQGQGDTTHPHPIVRMMDALGYDGAVLGNHEFNFGLEFLEASLANASLPFVCANLTRADGSRFLEPYAVLERALKTRTGSLVELKIGVIGFVPPQVMTWDKTNLDGKLAAIDIVEAGRRFVPELRSRCDILVALCHAGIKGGPHVHGEENAALQLAEIPGIDAIMTGHSHRVFPGKDYEGIQGVDAVKGTLHGVPAVMPGFWGSHCGVIDLTLTRTQQRWHVTSFDVEARPIYRRAGSKTEALTVPDPTVVAMITPLHSATLQWVEQPVGTIDTAIDSYFVWGGRDPATNLVNAGQLAYAAPLVKQAGLEHLPLLSAVAPFRVGYTPDSFIDIRAGKISLRDAASLYMYSSNTITIVRVTGAEVIEWLECSARVFNQIQPDAREPQRLMNPKVPSYNFDVISGLTYEIDVTKPARYSGSRDPSSDQHRISRVLHQGKAINLKAEYLVVTSNYRADGGGSFPGLGSEKIVLRAPDTNREAVLRYFRSAPSVSCALETPWKFARLGKRVSVWFDTAERVEERISTISGLSLLGKGDPGYARVALLLS